MPPKVHPADEAAARLIAEAKRFEIALFHGQGSYAKARAAALDEARAAAARLEAEVANGRPALIYALDAGSRSALVTPATFQAMEMHAMQKTYRKKIQRPARRRARRDRPRPDRGREDAGGLRLAREAGARGRSGDGTGTSGAGEGPAPRRGEASGLAEAPAPDPLRGPRSCRPEGQAAGGAGFQCGDPRPVPQQACAPRRSRRRG
jgi:hypothetical protein